MALVAASRANAGGTAEGEVPASDDEWWLRPTEGVIGVRLRVRQRRWLACGRAGERGGSRAGERRDRGV